jgi:hypothetical protein
MGLLRRKSMWERAVQPVTDRVDAKSLAKSGLTAAVSALTITAASAVLSSVRRKEQR